VSYCLGLGQRELGPKSSMGENGGARAQFIGAEEVTGGAPGGPSMAAFNSHVMGVEEDGSALVAEGEKERRPSGTDSRVDELAGGSPGGGGTGIKWRRQWFAPWTEGRRRLHGPRLGRLGHNFALKIREKANDCWALWAEMKEGIGKLFSEFLFFSWLV
jgi:hypothetical protein